MQKYLKIYYKFKFIVVKNPQFFCGGVQNKQKTALN